ncbi:MAG: DsbA family oxidoreductase [Pseudomonas sp.]|uniref:DsbA family oxidoreductase n=1 Tax=Pseudomonas sp. TaxID=306 RepID=UPI0033949E22
MSRPLQVEVFFDFICPWCLIGKRQFERALADLQAAQPAAVVDVTWRGVQLLPDLPASGLPFAEFYVRRLGSEQAVRQRQAQVREVAGAAGVNIDFAAIARMPNTADAHRLLARAAELGSPAQCDGLLERLFVAYFQNGEDLGDPATLLAIAESCGFALADLTDSLQGDGRPFVAGGMPANGVPYFVFGRHLSLSGAQPAKVLLRAMQEALAKGSAQ